MISLLPRGGFPATVQSASPLGWHTGAAEAPPIMTVEELLASWDNGDTEVYAQIHPGFPCIITYRGLLRHNGKPELGLSAYVLRPDEVLNPIRVIALNLGSFDNKAIEVMPGLGTVAVFSMTEGRPGHPAPYVRLSIVEP